MKKNYRILLIALLLLFFACKKDEKQPDPINVQVLIQGHVIYGSAGTVKYKVAGSNLVEQSIAATDYPNAKSYSSSFDAKVGDKIYFAAKHLYNRNSDRKDDAVQSDITIVYKNSATINNGTDFRVTHKVLSDKDVFREIEMLIPTYEEAKSTNYKILKEW